MVYWTGGSGPGRSSSPVFFQASRLDPQSPLGAEAERLLRGP